MAVLLELVILRGELEAKRDFMMTFAVIFMDFNCNINLYFFRFGKASSPKYRDCSLSSFALCKTMVWWSVLD